MFNDDNDEMMAKSVCSESSSGASSATDPSGTGAAKAKAKAKAPLPPPTPPVDMYGMTPENVYAIIRELRRQSDDSTTHQNTKEMLQKEPSVLLAVSRVLHESGLLRRAVVGEGGAVEEHLLPLPEAPTPQALSAPRSWTYS